MANAEVYKVMDADGNVTFTDNPPANDPTTEAVDLPEINTQPALPVPARGKAKEEEQQGYQEITIVSPAHDSTIPPGHQEVGVSVSLTPELQPGHQIQLIFNGQPYGSPTPTTSFSILSLIRGEHSIQVQVLDSELNVVGTSSTNTIHVKRHSIQHVN